MPITKNVESNEKVVQLKSWLSSIAEIDIENTLCRRQELGIEFHFSDAIATFEQIQQQATKLLDVDLSGLPAARIDALHKNVNATLTVFKRITEFKVVGETIPAEKRRADLLEEVEKVYATLFSAAQPALVHHLFTNARQLEVEEARREIIATAQQVKERSRQAGDLLKKIQETLEHSQEAAGEIGVTAYAKAFATAAEQHQRSSQHWLIASAALVFVIVASAIISLLVSWAPIGDMAGAQALHLTFTKLLVASVLVTALIWSGKMYRAHRHNTIVNEHRAHALSTFEAFVAAAQDDAQTKYAVLLQTTQSIFSAQSSGYAQEVAAGAHAPQILEIVREMTAKAKT